MRDNAAHRQRGAGGRRDPADGTTSDSGGCDHDGKNHQYLDDSGHIQPPRALERRAKHIKQHHQGSISQNRATMRP